MTVLRYTTMSIDTVIFDLDGVLLETEEIWNEVRHDFAVSHGGHWGVHDQPLVMGANSMQWAAHMREHNGVTLSDQEIYDAIIAGLRRRYAEHIPLIPGARSVVQGLSLKYRLGVASSSPWEIIRYALELAGLKQCFAAMVSSDEVSRGKPAPDVYEEACSRLGTIPRRAAAVEDSSSGLQAAHDAGMAVIAIPNPAYPPSPETLGLADVVLGSITELDPKLIESLGTNESEATR
jgi:HAD superfamily hydrolase (TIGR01509 family)